MNQNHLERQRLLTPFSKKQTVQSHSTINFSCPNFSQETNDTPIINNKHSQLCTACAHTAITTLIENEELLFALSLSVWTALNILYWGFRSWSTALRHTQPPPVHIHEASHYSDTQGGEFGLWRLQSVPEITPNSRVSGGQAGRVGAAMRRIRTQPKLNLTKQLILLPCLYFLVNLNIAQLSLV